jgi:hypothetical protein
MKYVWTKLKHIQLNFGDNIHGKRLLEGDKIHIIYLQSNGEKGKIDANILNVDSITLNVPGFLNSTEFLDICFGGYNNFKIKYSALFINNRIIKSNV